MLASSLLANYCPEIQDDQAQKVSTGVKDRVFGVLWHDISPCRYIVNTGNTADKSTFNF